MFPTYSRTKDIGAEWLGNIPEFWDSTRLKFLAKLNMGQSPSSEECNLDGVGVPFLQGNAEFGVVHPIPKQYCPSAKKHALAGDILLSVRAPVGALNVADQVYGIGRGLCAITPSENALDSQYAMFLLSVIKAELDSVATGSTYVAVSVEQVASIRAIAPPLSDQRAIASFLNRKTALIDYLISKRERQIELLQEQRTALISRAVTKGLNPDVPMKDSGVEWLGEVPTHWEVQCNRVLFQERIEYGIPGLPVLKVSLHSGVTEGEDDDGDSSRIRKMMDDKTAYKRAYAGDIAYNMMRAWQGAIGAVPVDGLVSPAYVVAKPTEGVESRYFEGLFRTSWYKKDFERYSYGIASFRWRLYWDQFKVLRSPVPPLNEQRAIADYIYRETTKIDTFVAKVQQSIDKLREYRQSLISAAVTGKIDVRNWQPSSEPVEESLHA